MGREEYRHLYRTARWLRLREQQLRAEPLCAYCRQLGRVTVANVADHKLPHRGDEQLFFDAKNLQSLCKPCHDSHKQAQEHNADGILRGNGHDGQPLDQAHPWHRPPRTDPPAATPAARPAAPPGGGEKFRAATRKTGPCPSYAEPRNG